MLHTFGNVSAVDRAAGVFAIKPSGVAVREADARRTWSPFRSKRGAVVDSTLRPSSDTPTHLELYRAFPSIGGIVHTHSEYATVFAQARQPIRCMGTTHADYFRGDVPVTRPMTEAEVERDYETNTAGDRRDLHAGAACRRTRCRRCSSPTTAPSRGAPDAFKAIEHAEVLEYLARVEWRVRALNPDAPRPDAFLVDKHHLRKHGPGAYYGQDHGM